VTAPATMDDVRLAWVALGCLVEPGSRTLGLALVRSGPVETLRDLLAGTLGSGLQAVAHTRLDGESAHHVALAAVKQADRLGARLVTPPDVEWPSQLTDLVRISRETQYRVDRDTFPPTCLWVRGPWPLADALTSSVAVVGARASTSYGEHAATELAYGLADRGWTVVSGGALGIDSAAHRGALAAGGLTMAVLACGIDRPYPVGNTALFERIAEQGLLISEWPPGAEPHRHRFLIRNRVIAAATKGTVIVEAAARSGATQTLRRATELNRVAMAVPGPVTSAMSVGCHQALREEQTRLVTGWPQVLEEVGSIGTDLAPLPRGPQTAWDDLDSTCGRVLDAVPRRKAAGPADIARAAGLPLNEVLAALGLLVAGGFVVDRPAGLYRLSSVPRPRTAAAAEVDIQPG
jgi:DNA processing protein